MKTKIILAVIAFLLVSNFNVSNGQQNVDSVSIKWELDNLKSVGGNDITLFGEPQVVETEFGKGIQFDGIDDGLIVNASPLDGAEEFTIEIMFRPFPSDDSANVEQRFLHIQNPANADRRILIELRLAENDKWFLDTFIKADTSRKTLYAEEFQHLTLKWYHAALTYSKGVMKHFVSGIEELSAEIDYLPIENGIVSIGMRMDERSWFRGTILFVRLSNRVLESDKFYTLNFIN